MIKYAVINKNSRVEFTNQQEAISYQKSNGGTIEQFEEAEQPPVVIIPEKVPLWCLRTVLRSLGLLQTVKDTIAAMPESNLKIAAEEGLEYSNTVLRNSPTTLFIQSVLQLTDAQVDEIFINADKVEA
ncbi:hypothetical protein ESA94_20500 [Lacibacter luteus]|uniref:Uncharacterized protein n=1 Tax=Lacibacter luteus TaxID=2508719 RepID=A0A4Q1CDZ4_9BACT|nr:hypothetical protein [Lacibacter luteus]RXK57582.1 hypothetical protein ESA94_20500 [Lacibacter luteus]